MKVRTVYFIGARFAAKRGFWLQKWYLPNLILFVKFGVIPKR
jgi:hypothetical protein